MKKLVILLCFVILSAISYGQVLTDKRMLVVNQDFSNMQYMFVVDSIDMYVVDEIEWNTYLIGDIVPINQFIFVGKVNDLTRFPIYRKKIGSLSPDELAPPYNPIGYQSTNK